MSFDMYPDWVMKQLLEDAERSPTGHPGDAPPRALEVREPALTAVDRYARSGAVTGRFRSDGPNISQGPSSLRPPFSCRVPGIHNWVTDAPRRRHCSKCRKEQVLMFYSNRSQEWVDVNTTGEEPR